MSRKRHRDDGDEVADGQVKTKRKRKYTESESLLANLFEQLSDHSLNVQLDAAAQLIGLYVAQGSPKTILRRLLRGLCSSRKAARSGFFIALVEALSSRSEVDIPELLEHVKHETQPQNGAAKSEHKDHALGRLTAYNAIVHAGLVCESSVPVESVVLFLRKTLELASSAPVLTEQCGKLWVDFVDVATACNGQDRIETLVAELHEAQRLHTPEGVAVWLHIRQSNRKARLPSGVWQKDDPLDRLNSVDTSKLRHSIRPGKATEQSQKNHAPSSSSLGNARRHPHFVWRHIVDALSADYVKLKKSSSIATSNEQASTRSIRLIWGNLVDDSFFREAASPETKALGLQICALAIASMPSEIVSVLFATRMLNCLANQIGRTDRFLHEAAADVMKQLKSRIYSQSPNSTLYDFVLAIVANLGEGHAGMVKLKRFQPSLEDIVRHAPRPLLRMLSDQITSLMSWMCDHYKDSTHGVEIMAELTSVLISNATAYGGIEEQDVIVGAIRTLLRQACVRQDLLGKVDSQSPKLLQVTRSRLWACMKEVVSAPMCVEVWPTLTYKALIACLGEDIGRPTLEEALAYTYAPSEASDLLLRTTAQLETVLAREKQIHGTQNKSAVDAGSLGRWPHALSILVAGLLLMTFCGDEVAVPLLQDLSDAVGQKGEPLRETNEACLSAMDTVLALLTKQEVFYRQATEQIVSVLANIFPQIVQKLVGLLGEEENLAGQRELFEEPSGQSETIEGDDSEGDTPSTSDVVEVLNGQDDAVMQRQSSKASSSSTGNGVTVESSATSSESDSDDGEDDDTSTDSSDQALNESLGQILGIHLNDRDDASAEGQSDSESDSSMSDNAMEAMGVDAKLAEIFRSRGQTTGEKRNLSARNNRTQAQRDAKRNVVMFKSRILGLLGAYVEECFAMPECLCTIRPLCSLVGSTRDAQLSKKAADLLENYLRLSRKRKDGLPIGAEETSLWQILEEVQEEALLWRGRAHLSSCSRASLYLARLLLAKTRTEGEDQVDSAAAVVAEKLRSTWARTRARKEDLGSELPELFWENFRTWLNSMGLEGGQRKPTTA